MPSGVLSIALWVCGEQAAEELQAQEEGSVQSVSGQEGSIAKRSHRTQAGLARRKYSE